MRNFIEKGDVITVTAGADITSGTAFLVGDLLAVAITSAVSGNQLACSICGVYELPKAAGAISQGVKIYWDDTAKNITTTSTNNKQIGYAWTAQLSGDATVFVKLPF